MLASEVAMTVRNVFKRNGSPKTIRMHPNDYCELKDEFGNPWTILMIAGIPIEIDAECPLNKIYVMET